MSAGDPPSQLREAPTHRDPRGALSVLTAGRDLPFTFDRCFWIHEAIVGVPRGGHAHRVQHQALICVAGSVEVLVDDGRAPLRLRLDRPAQVLHIPPMTWAEETSLAAGSVWVVLSSGSYDPTDYLKTRDAWLAAL